MSLLPPTLAGLVRRGGPFVALSLALSCAAVACGGNQNPASQSAAPKSAQPPSSRTGSSTPVRRSVIALGAMTTVAGGGKELGDGGPATAAGFCETTDVALDRAGDIYVADAGLYCEGPGANSVRRIDRNGVITTVAGGTGVLGAAGDGGPATKAQLNAPVAVAVDGQGELYISDSDNFRIRKVDTTGTITTVAGTGKQGFSGDGGPATSARLMSRPASRSTRATTSMSPITPPSGRSTAPGASPPSPAQANRSAGQIPNASPSGRAHASRARTDRPPEPS
jgi:hypothetical protein